MNSERRARLPSITALLSFERAATLGSFVAAARSLNLTASAVSHAIVDLEARLGVKLFERVGRGVALTPEGAQYLNAVRSALDTLDLAQRHLARQSSDRTIRVSASPFFSSVVLIPQIADFERAHPEYQLQISTSNAFVDFERDDVDVAIRVGGGSHDGLIVRKLLDVKAVPLCAPSLISGDPPLRGPADLVGHTLIHIAHIPVAWSLWLKGAGFPEIKGKRDLVFTSTLAVTDAIEAGLGVGLGISPLIEHHRSFGTRLVVPFGKPGRPEGQFDVVFRQDEANNPKLACFETWLRGVLDRLVS